MKTQKTTQTKIIAAASGHDRKDRSESTQNQRSKSNRGPKNPETERSSEGSQGGRRRRRRRSKIGQTQTESKQRSKPGGSADFSEREAELKAHEEDLAPRPRRTRAKTAW